MKIIKKIGFYIIFIGLLFIIPLSAFINMPVAKAEGSNTQNYTSDLETDSNVIEQVKDKSGYNQNNLINSKYNSQEHFYYYDELSNFNNGETYTSNSPETFAYADKDIATITMNTNTNKTLFKNFNCANLIESYTSKHEVHTYTFDIETSSIVYEIDTSCNRIFIENTAFSSSCFTYLDTCSSSQVDFNDYAWIDDDNVSHEGKLILIKNEKESRYFSVYRSSVQYSISETSGSRVYQRGQTYKINISYSPNEINFTDVNLTSLNDNYSNGLETNVYNTFSYQFANRYELKEKEFNTSISSTTSNQTTNIITETKINGDSNYINVNSSKSITFNLHQTGKTENKLIINCLLTFPNFSINNINPFVIEEFSKEGYSKAYNIYSNSNFISFNSELNNGLITSTSEFIKIDETSSPFVIKNTKDNKTKIFLRFIINETPTEEDLYGFIDDKKKTSKLNNNSNKYSTKKYINSNNDIIDINNIRIKIENYNKVVFYDINNNTYSNLSDSILEIGSDTFSNKIELDINKNGLFYIYTINKIGEVYRQFIEIDNTAISYGENIDTINNKPIKAIRDDIDNEIFGVWDNENKLIEVSNETSLILNLSEAPKKVIINGKNKDFISLSSTQIFLNLSEYSLKEKDSNGNSIIYEIIIVDDVYNVNNEYKIKINNNINNNFSINVEYNATTNNNVIVESLNSFLYINGIKKNKGEAGLEFNEEGIYNITIIDYLGKSYSIENEIGNIVYGFKFIIDKSDPVNILDKYNVYLDTWYNTYDYTTTKYYSFSSSDKAKAFAYYREYTYNRVILTNIEESVEVYPVYIQDSWVGNIDVIYSQVVDNKVYVYYNRFNSQLTVFYSEDLIRNYIENIINNSIIEYKNIYENYNLKYQAGNLVSSDNVLLDTLDNLYITEQIDETIYYNVFYTSNTQLTFNKLKDNNKTIRYAINNPLDEESWINPTDLSITLSSVSKKLYIELTNQANTSIKFIVIFDEINEVKIENSSTTYSYSSSSSNQTLYILGLSNSLTISSIDSNSPYIFKVKYNGEIEYKYSILNLIEEGKYEISLYDLALNYTKNLTIYYLLNINKTTLDVESETIPDPKNPDEEIETAFNFKVSYKRLDNEASPVVREILFTEDIETTKDSVWTLIASNIQVNLLLTDTYKFSEAGTYKLIVDDNIYSHNIEPLIHKLSPNAPIGYVYLFNSATGIYDLNNTEIAKTDVAKTNESFMITWIASTYTCSYELNNSTYSYTKNRKIVEEGLYKFRLVNGTNETIYNVLIDYTAPEGFITAYKKPNSSGTSTIINNSSKGYNVKISTLENLSFVEIQYNYIDSANQTKQASVYPNLIKEADSDYYSYLFDDELYNELLKRNLYNYEFKFILKDSLNNKRSYDFTIDKIDPKLQIKISNQYYKTNKITSKSFSFVYSSEVKDYYMEFTGINNIEKIYSPYSNIYTSESKLTAEGEYIMTVYDLCGNSTQLKVIIDNSNPILKLYYADNNEEVSNDTSKTKRDIKVIFNDDINCVVSYEGNNSETPISSNSILSDSYKYSITAYFTNGNENFYTRVIEIDKVAPVGQLYKESISTSNKLENGAKSNKTVYLKCNERNVKAYLVIEDIEQELSFDFDNSVNVKNEGNHLIKLVDDLGNESFYNFSIKKSSPEARLELYNSNDELLSDTLYTNGYAKFFYNENWSALTKNENNEEVALTSNYFTQEKEYYIKIIDDYGNTNVYTFEICKDLSEGYFYNFKTDEEFDYCDDLIINYDFYFKFSKHTCLINGEAYTSKTRIKDEGSYEIQLTNIYGSKTIYHITLDKTLPQMRFYSNNSFTSPIESYYYNSDVYWKIENECNVLSINEQTYTENSNYGLITLENVYTFEISDKAGNKNVITFTIDKTNPTLAFYKSKIKDSNIVDLEENQEYVLTNDKTYIENIEKTSSIFVNNELVSLDNNSYLISNEGYYEIKCIDLAGNSIQYYLIINKEIPTGILNIDNASSTNKAVKFEFDSNVFSATLNNNKYLSGDEITDEGKYEIIIYNSFGSSNNYTFEIDKTNPILKFTKEFSIYTNKSVSYDDIEKGATLYLDNEVYEKTSVSSEGAHTLKIVDKAGNYTEYKFEIKKEFDENLFTIEQDPETKHVSIKKDSSVKLILNDEEINDDEIILTEAMTYKYKFIDKYGNINEDSFRIKLPKTANNTINNVLTIIIVIGFFVVVIASVSIYIRNRSKKPKLF